MALLRKSHASAQGAVLSMARPEPALERGSGRIGSNGVHENGSCRVPTTMKCE